MTAQAVTASATPPAAPPPGPRTARTVLRVHRTGLIVWACLFAALAGWLVYITEVAAYDERTMYDACAVQDACDMTIAGLRYSEPLGWIGTLVAYAFLAVAAFAGGALMGRELESGTARLGWTQGVTPTRWLAAKLAVPALALALGTGVLVLVFRWAWAAHPDLIYEEWAQTYVFLARGPTAVAYVLCALAVGTLTALLIRRTLASLGVSVAVMLVVSLVIGNYRSSLWPAVHVVTTEDFGGPDGQVWQLGYTALVHGKPAPNLDYWQCEGSPADMQRCYDDLGITGFRSTYHPASHYLPLNLVETGIVLAVAALATFAAFALLRRRTR